MELSVSQLAQVKMLSRAKTLKGTSAKAKMRVKGKGAGEEEGDSDKAKITAKELPSVMRAMLGADDFGSPGPGPATSPGTGPGPGSGPVCKNNGVHGKSTSKAPRPRTDPRIQYSEPTKPSSSPSATPSSGRGGGNEEGDDAVDNIFMAGVLEDMLLHSKDAKDWTDDDDEHMAEHIAFVSAMNGHRMLSSADVSGSRAGGVGLPPKPSLSLPVSSFSSSPGGKGKGKGKGKSKGAIEPPRAPARARDRRYATERGPTKKLDILYKRNSNRSVGGSKSEADQQRVQRLAACLAKIYILNDEKRKQNDTLHSLPNRLQAKLLGRNPDGSRKKKSAGSGRGPAGSSLWNPLRMFWPRDKQPPPPPVEGKGAAQADETVPSPKTKARGPPKAKGSPKPKPRYKPDPKYDEVEDQAAPPGIYMKQRK